MYRLSILFFCLLSIYSGTLSAPQAINTNKPVYIGCPSDEQEVKEILQIHENSLKAWNNHNIDNLIKYYAPNFSTRDGMRLDQVKNNLGLFWFNYPDSRLTSQPMSIYVCGDYATVDILEITKASKNKNNQNTINFVAHIRGLTYFKKINNQWQITKEIIKTESIWKYSNELAEKALEDGYFKLLVDEEVEAGSNYIAKIKYHLPDNIKALVLIDKTLLGEFEENPLDILSKDVDLHEAREQQRLTEISRAIGNTGDNNLRRLFTSNKYGQSELITAHIELVEVTNTNKIQNYELKGMLSLSQRIQPYAKIEPEKKEKFNTQSFRNEYLKQTMEK